MNKTNALALSLVASYCSDTNATEAVQYGLGVTVEHFQNLSGGVKTGSRTLGSADFTVFADTSAAGWWENGELFGYVLANYGKDPADLVGNWQGMSNIAADDEIKLYELWYQHRFFADTTKLLVGLHDYNASFYSLGSASHFTLPPFGIGSEVAQVGPSVFPTTALAAMLSIDIEHYYGRFALYDGIAGHPQGKRGTHIRFDDGDGVFRAAELGIAKEGNYKLGIGYWQHNARVDNPVNGNISRDNSGWYIIAEQYLNQQFALFIQAGIADKTSNQVAHYYGAGATYTDAWLAGDTIGLAVAHARNSKPFLQQNPEFETTETAWELSYTFKLNPYFSLQNSAYYVQNPGMQTNVDTALAVGFRLIFTLE